MKYQYLILLIPLTTFAAQDYSITSYGGTDETSQSGTITREGPNTYRVQTNSPTRGYIDRTITIEPGTDIMPFLLLPTQDQRYERHR